jgi:RimJ/RimL family protein N-acetyltransferase
MELRDGDLLLREWTFEDVPAIVEACSDPEIPRWIPFVPVPYTERDAAQYVEACLTSGDDRFAFAMASAEDGRILGSIDVRVNAMRTGHIGYWVARDARGKGVCTHALRLLSRWAVTDLRLGRLELITDPDNVASQRVAEKAGFRREAVLRSHLLWRDGRRRDSVMFSLLPEELYGGRVPPRPAP